MSSFHGGGDSAREVLAQKQRPWYHLSVTQFCTIGPPSLPSSPQPSHYPACISAGFPWTPTLIPAPHDIRETLSHPKMWAFFSLFDSGIFGNPLGYMPKRNSLVTVRSYVPHLRLTIVSPRVLKVLPGQNGMKGETTDVCFLLVWGFSLLRKSKTLHHPGRFSTQSVTAHSVRAITSAEPARPALPQVSVEW